MRRQLFAAFVGRLPGQGDSRTLEWIGTAVILVTTLLLLCGKSIERLLEKLSWAMIVFIFTFLTVVNVLFVPVSGWLTALEGFAIPHPLPPGIDIVLLGLFAATAGSGGLGNLAITNWFRDKGFGMGRMLERLAAHSRSIIRK